MNDSAIDEVIEILNGLKSGNPKDRMIAVIKEQQAFRSVGASDKEYTLSELSDDNLRSVLEFVKSFA